MSTTPTSVSTATFARFLDLEQQARAANSTEELAYCIVNDSQPLFSFRHAALVINGKVRAVTGVTQPAPHAPLSPLLNVPVRSYHPSMRKHWLNAE